MRGNFTKRPGELNSNYRHGASVGKQTAEYQVYSAARQRCVNPKTKDYENYGGRGIRFVFNDFTEFIAHIGDRPTDKHTLDRVDNDGNYEPGNVRWATRLQQNNNRRKRRWKVRPA